MLRLKWLNMCICFVFFIFPCRYNYGAIERTPCVVHTLQLAVNMVQKDPPIRRLLEKVRHLESKFRKSSVATERLLQKCALVLVKDCPTRWSSSFAMILCCLEVKEHLTAVAESMSWDSLQTSEWQKIGMLRALLLPFAKNPVAWKWHSVTFSCCASAPGSQKPSDGILTCTWENLQRCSYSGPEDAFQYG